MSKSSTLPTKPGEYRSVLIKFNEDFGPTVMLFESPWFSLEDMTSLHRYAADIIELGLTLLERDISIDIEYYNHSVLEDTDD